MAWVQNITVTLQLQLQQLSCTPTPRTSAVHASVSAHMRARVNGEPTHLLVPRKKKRRASWPWWSLPHGRVGSSGRPAGSDRRDALPGGARPLWWPFAGEQRLARRSGEEEEGGRRLLPLLRPAPLTPARSGPSAPAPPCPMHLPRPLLHDHALNWVLRSTVYMELVLNIVASI